MVAYMKGATEGKEILVDRDSGVRNGNRPGADAVREDAKQFASDEMTAGSMSPTAELKTKLAALPLLEGFDSQSIEALADELVWLSLPGGQCLFRAGDREDSLYIVISGRLGAFLPNDEGQEVLARQMVSGETVGEMAMLSGEPRSASVYAMRDTELVMLSKASFERLMDEHPKTLRFVTDLLVRRLQRPPRPHAAKEAPKTIAIVPLFRGEVTGFAHSLAQAFKEMHLDAALIDHDLSDRPVGWFNALEDSHDVLLYQADFESTPWSHLCLRQADCVLLVTDSGGEAVTTQLIAESESYVPRRAPVELAIVHGSGSYDDCDTAGMLERLKPRLHHHVRRGDARDFRKLARMLTGRAVGIVLSGGGARGLAHVGVLRALSEAGIEIDLYGGVSMGSIIAGGAALGWDDKTLTAHMRAAFTVDNPISDYTVPMVALVRGRKTSRFLRAHFLDSRIENCPFTYFCISTNVTKGRLKIHRTGPLWLATRASISIPGVLPPVVEGSDILIDGGIMNNLPIDVMSNLRRGPIIAADVTTNYGFQSSIDEIDSRPLWQLVSHARKGTPNILTVLMAAGTISSYAQVRTMRTHVDLLIEPHLSQISMLNWKAFDAVVEIGYQTTMKLIEERKGELSSANFSLPVSAAGV